MSLNLPDVLLLLVLNEGNLAADILSICEGDMCISLSHSPDDYLPASMCCHYYHKLVQKAPCNLNLSKIIITAIYYDLCDLMERSFGSLSAAALDPPPAAPAPVPDDSAAASAGATGASAYWNELQSHVPPGSELGWVTQCSAVPLPPGTIQLLGM